MPPLLQVLGQLLVLKLQVRPEKLLIHMHDMFPLLFIVQIPFRPHESDLHKSSNKALGYFS